MSYSAHLFSSQEIPPSPLGRSSRAVLNALKGLQEKIRHLESERSRHEQQAKAQEDELEYLLQQSAHRRQLEELTREEHTLHNRLEYEKLSKAKSVMDQTLMQAEVDVEDLKAALSRAEEAQARAGAPQRVVEAEASMLQARVVALERELHEMKRLAQERVAACSRADHTHAQQLETLNTRLQQLAQAREGHVLATHRAEEQLKQMESNKAKASKVLEGVLAVNEALVQGQRHNHIPHGLDVPAGMPQAQLGFDIAGAVSEALRADGQERACHEDVLAGVYERIGFNAMKHEAGVPEVRSPSRQSKGAGSPSKGTTRQEFFGADAESGYVSPGRSPRTSRRRHPTSPQQLRPQQPIQQPIRALNSHLKQLARGIDEELSHAMKVYYEKLELSKKVEAGITPDESESPAGSGSIPAVLQLADAVKTLQIKGQHQEHVRKALELTTRNCGVPSLARQLQRLNKSAEMM
ncbi:unnamed protein product, partial [Chrysoparadoxa australica]